MKRSGPLRRGKPLRSRTRLTRTGQVTSARRRTELAHEQLARRVAVSQAFARDGHRCQAATRVPSVTCAGGLDGHEPLTRARGGNPLDPDQILTVCRAHHEWIHAHPSDATTLGLLISQHHQDRP